jgi:hypothetical protein
MMATRWIETRPETYRAIYSAHKEDLHVFTTYTHCDEPVEMLTEWGFADADCPIIKSHERDGKWVYFIACVTKDDAESSTPLNTERDV